jgi:hypothetical protein
MLSTDLDFRIPVVGEILYGHGRRGKEHRGIHPNYHDFWTKVERHRAAVELSRKKAERNPNSRQNIKLKMQAHYHAMENPTTAAEIRRGRRWRIHLEQERTIAFIHDEVMTKVGQQKLKRDRLIRVERNRTSREERIRHNVGLFLARKPKTAEGRKIRGLMHMYENMDPAFHSKANRQRLLMKRITRKQLEQELQLKEERKLLRDHRKHVELMRADEASAAKLKAAEKESGLWSSLKRQMANVKGFLQGKIPNARSGITVEPVINETPQESPPTMPLVQVAPMRLEEPRKAQMAPDEKWIPPKRETKAPRLVSHGGYVFRETETGILIPSPLDDAATLVNMLDRMRVS